MNELNGPRAPIGNTALVAMPDVTLSDFDQRIGEVKGVLGQLRPDTILLDSAQYFIEHDWRTTTPTELSSVFIEEPVFGLGRQYSANGVYFGQTIVSSEAMLDLPEFVAVKPHLAADTSGVSVMRELAAHNHMNSISKAERAYVPLGLWRDSAGMPQLVTLYDHDVQTYDNIFWPTTEVDAAKITPEQVRDAFNSCMYGLGLLNGSGTAHGDAQVKNHATDRRRVRFVDFEKMELIPLGEANADEAKDMIESDLDTLVSSTLFYNEVDGVNYNGAIVDVAADLMTEPYERLKLAASYLLGFNKSKTRLGTDLPDGALVTEADILRSFDFAVQISESQRGDY